MPVTISGIGRTSTIDFLLSKDGKKLVRFEKVDVSDDVMTKVDLRGRPVRGRRDAKVTIVNYDDLQCPYCTRLHQTLFPNILKTYGDRIRVIYKDFPLSSIHPWALHAANDANCLAAQSEDAYWGFADAVHGDQREINSEKGGLEKQFATLDSMAANLGGKHHLDGPKLSACLKAQSDTAVKASENEGTSLGIESTPTLFVNGEKIIGALPEEALWLVLDRALHDAGESAPAHPSAQAKPAPTLKR